MITRRLLSRVPSAVRMSRRIATSVTRQQRETVAEREVPVVTYADDEHNTAAKDGQLRVLTVDALKTKDNILPIVDVANQAFALKKGVVDQLTPTLKKFTLHGKVAIVTGYVQCHCLFWSSRSHFSYLLALFVGLFFTLSFISISYIAGHLPHVIGICSMSIDILPISCMLTLIHAASFRGARGLGYNMAQALCEVGVKAIAIMDVQQELGDQAAAELHDSTGIPVQFYKVDVRDHSAIQEVVANVVDTFGSVDVLINSAGIAE